MCVVQLARKLLPAECVAEIIGQTTPLAGNVGDNDPPGIVPSSSQDTENERAQSDNAEWMADILPVATEDVIAGNYEPAAISEGTCPERLSAENEAALANQAALASQLVELTQAQGAAAEADADVIGRSDAETESAEAAESGADGEEEEEEDVPEEHLRLRESHATDMQRLDGLDNVTEKVLRASRKIEDWLVDDWTEEVVEEEEEPALVMPSIHEMEIESIKILPEARHDPFVSGLIVSRNIKGETALMHAALRGANAHTNDQWISCSQLVAGHVSCVELLVNAQAIISAEDEMQCKPLHHAALGGQQVTPLTRMYSLE